MAVLLSDCQNPKDAELCRLCLEKSSNLISLFDFEPLENPLKCPLINKISLCLSVQITHDDKVTTKVCHSCAVKVDEFYIFYNKTAESQKLLAQWEFEMEVQRATESSVKTDFTSVLDGSSEILDGALSLQEEEERGEKRKNDDILKVVDNESLAATFDVDPATSDTDLLNIDQLALLSQDKPEEQFNLGIKKVEKAFMCGCGAKFSCRKYLLRHKSRHNAKAKVPCSLCERTFKNNSELKDHQKSHKLGEMISCDKCDFTTMYKSNMQRHMRRHRKQYKFFCEICCRGFYSKNEIVTHRIIKHGDKPFSCETCGKTFNSPIHFSIHNRTHFINEEFLCEMCGKSFKTKYAVKRHMKTHSYLPFPCQICGKVLTEGSVKKHMKIHGDKNIVCDVCGKAFVDKKYMAAHMRFHDGERPYGCGECGKRYTSKNSLKIHQRFHSGERPYVCQYCGSGFVTKSLLTSHIKNHKTSLDGSLSSSDWLDGTIGCDDIKEILGEDEETPKKCGRKSKPDGIAHLFDKKTQRYKCDKCHYSCASKGNFKKHVMRHKKAYKLTCEECNRGFYNIAAYKQHAPDGNCMQNLSFQCPKCSRKYHLPSKLKEHLKIHDADFSSPLFQCDACGKTFVTKRGMEKHIQSVHLGVRHKCELCGKEVTCVQSLRNHMKLHNGGEKSFVCSVCGKSFSCMTGLVVHERTHTGAKPYKCDICKKSFTQPSTLKVHKRYHTGERPFTCNICDKKFFTNNHLTCHLKTHLMDIQI